MKLSATLTFNCIVLMVKFGQTSCEDIPLALLVLRRRHVVTVVEKDIIVDACICINFQDRKRMPYWSQNLINHLRIMLIPLFLLMRAISL